MYRTYVINLKRDIERYHNLKRELAKRNVPVQRFDAIYGKEIKDYGKYSKYISKYCQIFCPSGLVGCGLSHYVLLDQIYQSYITNDPDGNVPQYTLVLEDDVVPLFEDKTVIDAIVQRMPDDADILLLYCQGQCGYAFKPGTVALAKKYLIPQGQMIGSTAAYVIRNTSIPKFLKDKLTFHVDLQWYLNPDIKVCIYNDQLFSIKNDHSYNLDPSQAKRPIAHILDSLPFYFDNTTLSESLAFKIFKIPLVNVELSAMDVIIILITALVASKI